MSARRLVRVLVVLLLALPLSAGAAQAQARVPAGDSLLDVVVATRRLPRGTVLTARDLAPARRPVGGVLRTTYTPAAPGWVARRVIQAGEVLRTPAVAPAPLVAAGSAVRFTLQHDGLSLTLDGTAPVAGALGDTIPVRLGARRQLRGVVTGPAHVTAFDSASDSSRTR